MIRMAVSILVSSAERSSIISYSGRFVSLRSMRNLSTIWFRFSLSTFWSLTK